MPRKPRKHWRRRRPRSRSRKQDSVLKWRKARDRVSNPDKVNRPDRAKGRARKANSPDKDRGLHRPRALAKMEIGAAPVERMARVAPPPATELSLVCRSGTGQRFNNRKRRNIRRSTDRS